MLVGAERQQGLLGKKFIDTFIKSRSRQRFQNGRLKKVKMLPNVYKKLMVIEKLGFCSQYFTVDTVYEVSTSIRCVDLTRFELSG